MRKIKRILKICALMLLLSTFAFAFKISELEFGKTVEIGKEESKEFLLKNNGLEPILYRLSIEENKDVSVSPRLLNILPQQEKKFKIKVKSKVKLKGKYNYFLVIKEDKKKKREKGVDLNKIYKIKQTYIVK